MQPTTSVIGIESLSKSVQTSMAILCDFPSFLQGVCQFIKGQVDSTSVDSLFFAAEISQAISGCEV